MINILLVIDQIESDEQRTLIAEIYNEYSSYILKIARNIMKNQSDAEDAVGDAFIKIIKYREKFMDFDRNETKQ